MQIFVKKGYFAAMAIFVMASFLWLGITAAQAANRTNMVRVQTPVGDMMAAKNVPIQNNLANDMIELGVPQSCYDEALDLIQAYIAINYDDLPDKNPRLTIFCDISVIENTKGGFLGRALGSRVQPGGLRYIHFVNDRVDIERFMVDPPQYREQQSYKGIFQNLFQLASANLGSKIPATRSGIGGAPDILMTPVKYTRISSGFGYRTHPIYKTRKMHSGIDYAAPFGTPVVSACSGTVTANRVSGTVGNQYNPAQKGRGYGYLVKIKCDNGYETRYGHLQELGNVRVGQRVTQGQVIGKVGSTGGSTGPHLHYEVRTSNGVAVNPDTLDTLPTNPTAFTPGQLAGLGNTTVAIDGALVGLENYGGGALNEGQKPSNWCSSSVGGHCPPSMRNGANG